MERPGSGRATSRSACGCTTTGAISGRRVDQRRAEPGRTERKAAQRRLFALAALGGNGGIPVAARAHVAAYLTGRQRIAPIRDRSRGGKDYAVDAAVGCQQRPARVPRLDRSTDRIDVPV